VLNDKNARVPILSCHEIGPDKRVFSNQINIKWNFNEFEVDYDCLKQGYLVGGYFLTKLL
jgi:hypothetical protein